jgi:hypothetical protein
MSHQEILAKAIQKAIDGGWELIHELPAKWYSSTDGVNVHFNDKAGGILVKFSSKDVIFNHEFAKALWSERRVMTHKEQADAGVNGLLADGRMIDLTQPGWEHHLQNMVLAEDPIAYLGEHTNG